MIENPSDSGMSLDRKLSVTIVIMEELLLDSSMSRDWKLLAISDLVMAIRNRLIPPFACACYLAYSALKKCFG